MNQYLIPANSKRSMMILGLFTPVDFGILLTGIGITVILLLIIQPSFVKEFCVCITPVVISGVMVAPVPNHRNVWQLTANIYAYFSNRRTYFWRGWCMLDGEENNTK